MARPGHDHLVMGLLKWAAACVLVHLVGTSPGVHLCLAGRHGPIASCMVQPACHLEGSLCVRGVLHDVRQQVGAFNSDQPSKTF